MPLPDKCRLLRTGNLPYFFRRPTRFEKFDPWRTPPTMPYHAASMDQGSCTSACLTISQSSFSLAENHASGQRQLNVRMTDSLRVQQSLPSPVTKETPTSKLSLSNELRACFGAWSACTEVFHIRTFSRTRGFAAWLVPDTQIDRFCTLG